MGDVEIIVVSLSDVYRDCGCFDCRGFIAL